MPATTRRQKRTINPAWGAWQCSSISKRWLAPEARRAGYTVVRVLPACRDLFLDMAELLLLYGDLVHKHHQFSRETLDALAQWHQATQALTHALGKEH
jgi:hypothetical protein